MTELERKALIGDQEAQRECTEKRIVLSCPCCGCEERDMIGLSVSHDQYYYSCEACGCNGPIVFDSDSCDYPEYDALAVWNRRPAPPIGRCGECKEYDTENCSEGCGWCQVWDIGRFDDGFCDKFKSKGREENENE